MLGYDVYKTLYLVVKFKITGSRVKTLGRDHFGHIVKMYYILKSFFSTLIYLRKVKSMFIMSKKRSS